MKQFVTLTTNIDSYVGTTGDDTFIADHTTLSAADSINGGAGIDTFNYTDARTSAVAGDKIPAALVSNVEIINVRNVNGSAAVAATKEVATITFSDFTYGDTALTVTVGDVNHNFNASTTGAEFAAYFAAQSFANYDLTSVNGNQLILTAKTAGVITDITLTASSGGTSTGGTASKAIVQGTNSVASSGVEDTVNASNFVGATDFNSNLSLNKVSFTNLATGQSAGIIGNGSITTGNLDATYGGSVSAAKLNFAGGTNGGDVTVIGTGLQTLTVNSTGAANKIGALAGATSITSTTIDATTNLTTGAVTNAGSALTIKGSGAVNLSTTALQAGVTKIDASGNTGGVTVALGTTVTQTVTGGTGNDVITSGAVLTTGSVDAGAGTDTLVLGSNVNHANTAALAAKYTNFEILRVNGTFDASLIAGITAIELSGTTNNISKLSATQANAVKALADIGATTLSLATDTAADVISLSLGDGKGAAFDTGALTVNGIETLNIKANAKAGNTDQTSVIASFAADKLTAINLTGTAVTLTDAATTKAVTIDASGLTGTGGATSTGLTITEGNLVKGSRVTGSAVADTLTTTAAITGTSGDFVIYNAGAGNDLISATVAAINNTSGANGSVKIDGGDGTDTLSLTDATGLTLVDANVQYVTNVEKISYVVANQAINITSGGFFDTNFKTNGVTLDLGNATNAQANTVDLTSFTGKASVTLDATAATAVNQSVTTGSGDDTVTVKAAGTTTGTVTVSTGAGNDTINITAGAITTGQVVVNGGAGQDTINITGLSHTVNAAADLKVIVGAGQSTLDAFDSITGVLLSNGTSQGTVFDFDGNATQNVDVAASSVTGYTAAELTYTVTNGMLAFAGTSAAALTATQKATLAQQLITDEGKTVAFTAGADSYVFNNAAAGDSLVKLVGVTVLGLGNVTTNGFIEIA